MASDKRDHGGGIDEAARRYGGSRIDWIDLSTGINPVPYPVSAIPTAMWQELPDEGAQSLLLEAARTCWAVPDDAAIVAAPGASALISRIPEVSVRETSRRVVIPGPTYNEHAAAFQNAGWSVATEGTGEAQVIVHPNNPDGRLWQNNDLPVQEPALTVIDESFCDTSPQSSWIAASDRPGTIILKSFGKFWGLAGLRLGFAIGDSEIIAKLREALGPWAVSGPALHVGAIALADTDWARQTRKQLRDDAKRLDQLMLSAGASVAGGTSLFRLYQVNAADEWQDRLARHRIWSRRFPYRNTWLRLGLPAPDQWHRLEIALR